MVTGLQEQSAKFDKQMAELQKVIDVDLTEPGDTWKRSLAAEFKDFEGDLEVIQNKSVCILLVQKTGTDATAKLSEYIRVLAKPQILNSGVATQSSDDDKSVSGKSGYTSGSADLTAVTRAAPCNSYKELITLDALQQMGAGFAVVESDDDLSKTWEPINEKKAVISELLKAGLGAIKDFHDARAADRKKRVAAADAAEQERKEELKRKAAESRTTMEEVKTEMSQKFAEQTKEHEAIRQADAKRISGYVQKINDNKKRIGDLEKELAALEQVESLQLSAPTCLTRA